MKVAIIGHNIHHSKMMAGISKAKTASVIIVDNREEYREKFWKNEKEKARKRRQIEIAKMIETVAI